MSKETPEKTPQISSAKDFKAAAEARENGEVITLMSGLTVKLKRPSVNKLVASGVIPADAAAALSDAQTSKKMTTGTFAKLQELQQIIARYSLVEPRVSNNPNYDDNEISIDDLSDVDLGQIMAYVQSGVAAMATFRTERPSDNTGLDLSPVSEPTA